jgi:hypothetical protein
VQTLTNFSKKLLFANDLTPHCETFEQNFCNSSRKQALVAGTRWSFWLPKAQRNKQTSVFVPLDEQVSQTKR